jgi:hypothetical protein
MKHWLASGLCLGFLGGCIGGPPDGAVADAADLWSSPVLSGGGALTFNDATVVPRITPLVTCGDDMPCLIPLTEHPVYRLRQGGAGVECAAGAPSAWCAEDRFMAGAVVHADGTFGPPGVADGVTSTVGDWIAGTDLGISAQLGAPGVTYFNGVVGGHTLVYYGDTEKAAKSSLRDCRGGLRGRCNDAIGVIPSSENTPLAGVDSYIATEKYTTAAGGEEWGFMPLRIPGVNTPDANGAYYSVTFGSFNTPTGAASTIWPIAAGDLPVIYAWYATASNNWDKDNQRTKAKSWLACTADGVHFASCSGDAGAKLFSSDKFIQVSAMEVSSNDFETLCPAGSTDALCKLPVRNKGFLLLGTGERYRCSPMYLAFMPIVPFGDAGVYYYRKSGGTVSWVNDEASATPVIRPAASVATQCVDLALPGTTMGSVWTFVGASEGKRSVFGEIAGQIVRPSAAICSKYPSACAPRIALLSYHDNHFPLEPAERWVHFRTAPLSKPDTWSTPVLTSAKGYGNYFIGRYTSVVDEGSAARIKAYHLSSAWHGPSGDTPYGIYSRPLRLKAADGTFPRPALN